MPTPAREAELLDAMWERVEKLLPPHPPQPRGGRPFCSDRDAFAGIVYVLRNAIRWQDMPEEFPSGSTCWRRMTAWSRAGLWTTIHAIVVGELQAAGLLDTRELFVDATFAEDRKGGRVPARRSAAWA